MNHKTLLLDWCKQSTESYHDVEIKNFSSSWNDGMAFCALVHNYIPEAFDYSLLNKKNALENFTIAFDMANKYKKTPILVTPQEMMDLGKNPNQTIILTYISALYKSLQI